MWTKIPADATKVFAWVLFDVYQKEVEQFDGTYKTFEWVKGYDSAKAICVVDERIVILHTQMPWSLNFYQLPGGIIEQGEDADMAIKREVEEETGIVFAQIEKIHTGKSNIWLVDSSRHYYIARQPVSFGQQNLDVGGEKIEIEYITFEQMLDLVFAGKVFNTLGDWILREYVLTGKIGELRSLLFGK